MAIESRLKRIEQAIQQRRGGVAYNDRVGRAMSAANFTADEANWLADLATESPRHGNRVVVDEKSMSAEQRRLLRRMVDILAEVERQVTNI